MKWSPKRRDSLAAEEGDTKMGILDGLQQFVFRNLYWIDIQRGKRAQNRGDWLARDRGSKKCRKSKKRPLSPPPCSCAALLQVASKPPLFQVSDPNCCQRGRLSLMCWVPLSTKRAGSCLNWYKKGQARDELVSGHKNQSGNCINANWEWYFYSLWTMFVWWNFITRALNLQ